MGRPRKAAEQTTSTLYRGADGHWHARVTMGRRPDGTIDRRHVQRRTKTELRDAVRELEHRRDTEGYTWTQGDPTLGDWLEHWLDAVLPMTARWKTLSTYRSQMRLHVLPTLGNWRMSEIQPEHLEAHYRRPPGFYRRLQSVAPVFSALGLTPDYVVRLEVPGRRTGLIRSSFMVLVVFGGQRYLVALAGESEWVRNVRAAHGHVVLRHDGQRYAARLTEVPVTERAEVIRAYIHRPSPRGRPMVRTGEARHYFGIEPDATPSEIQVVAPNYPVFRVERVALASPSEP